MPALVRPAMHSLFEIDCAMGDVVAGSTEPGLGRIKLAWWREQLELLDRAPPPAEPRLRSAAERLLPTGIAGAELAGLAAGWATLLEVPVEPALVAERGRRLFGIGGRLLQSSDAALGEAGTLYALASVTDRGLAELDKPARQALETLGHHRFERRARPLTMLARAAASRGSSRSRALAMLAHRWSGVIG